MNPRAAAAAADTAASADVVSSPLSLISGDVMRGICQLFSGWLSRQIYTTTYE